MKLPPVLLLLVSVLISNDKLHKVITTLALELQGQKQSFLSASASDALLVTLFFFLFTISQIVAYSTEKSSID